MEYLGEEIVAPGGGAIGFNRKVAASDGFVYKVSEAEEKDLKNMVENSCMACNRLLAKGEIKVVPPEYVQERDPYVLEGFVKRRVLCVACYEKMTSSTRERVKAKYKNVGNDLRARLAKSLFQGSLAKR